MGPKEVSTRADAFSVWEVEVPNPVHLHEVCSHLKLSLFDAEFESYSDRSIIKMS